MPCYDIACDGHLHCSDNLYYSFFPLERGRGGKASHALYGFEMRLYVLRYTANLAINLERPLTFPEFFEHAFLGTSRFEVYFRLFGKDKSLILLLKLKARKEAV